MKILAVSDKDDSKLQACILQNMQFLQDVDIVISCGDISKSYLEFLVDSLKKPLFFVKGNHQTFHPSDHNGYLEKFISDIYETDKHLSFGGSNLHARVEQFKDYILVGFEGSMKYNKGPFQYTQQEMTKIVKKIETTLYLIQFKDFILRRKKRKVIAVSHAPIVGIHDQKDLCHQGFARFKVFLNKFKPVVWLHGHIHFNDQRNAQITKINQTLVVNAYGFHIINISDDNVDVVSNAKNLL
ncbi:MAG: metallophosphoesterase [Endomicrobiaceae bacterium]|nr:metallophosphoesterase [Endomicrobiaceae bacterium]